MNLDIYIRIVALIENVSFSLFRTLLVQRETAAVNIQLDSYVGGIISRTMHPLRAFVTFH